MAKDLLAHREWWEAVLLDRGETSSLIKLRDLPPNDWNVDTLYVLAKDESSAQRLAEMSEAWSAAEVEVHSQQETRRLKSRQQQRSLPTQAESAEADFAAVGAVFPRPRSRGAPRKRGATASLSSYVSFWWD